MTQQTLSELARVKAVFQARTIALILGAKPPEVLPSGGPLPSSQDKDR